MKRLSLRLTVLKMLLWKIKAFQITKSPPDFSPTLKKLSTFTSIAIHNFLFVSKSSSMNFHLRKHFNLKQCFVPSCFQNSCGAVKNLQIDFKFKKQFKFVSREFPHASYTFDLNAHCVLTLMCTRSRFKTFRESTDLISSRNNHLEDYNLHQAMLFLLMKTTLDV
ncbi:CLUMA_CG000650, isoform A [Clunio marinus]|uniref:CLUMA_CG000650, isoform A n=1 Tax=Clunio marinus TaxID=568069 RepID=A0A1J1HFM5_9DIPT|nr:CLUMA_CG000650, isoform A [Clunio marinus]